MKKIDREAKLTECLHRCFAEVSEALDRNRKFNEKMRLMLLRFEREAERDRARQERNKSRKPDAIQKSKK
jgi:hypothetical protein